MTKDIEPKAVNAPVCCGAPMVKNGKTGRYIKTPGQRWYCRSCGHSTIVRDGVVTTFRGRPPLGYWTEAQA